jgi:hypothetical protein
MKGHYLFRSFPGFASSFSGSIFEDEDEHTAWVKGQSEEKTEVLVEQTRLNAALSATDAIGSGRARNKAAAVKSQRLTLFLEILVTVINLK